MNDATSRSSGHKADSVTDPEFQKRVRDLVIGNPDTRQVAKQVAAMLFFDLGKTPTANQVQGLIGRGSHSTVGDALDEFWSEFRDKMSMRLKNPDVPEPVLALFSDTSNTVWSMAMQHANAAAEQTIAQRTSALQAEALRAREEATQHASDKQRLEGALAEARAQAQQLQENARELLERLEAQTRLADEAQTLRRQAEVQLQAEQQRAQAERDESRRQIEALSARLEQDAQSHAETSRRQLLEIDAQRTKVKELEQSVRRRDNEYQALRDERDTAAQQHHLALATLQASLAASEARHQAVLDSSRLVEQHLEGVQRDLASVRADRDATQRNMSQIVDESAAKDRRLQIAEGMVRDLRDRLDAARAQPAQRVRKKTETAATPDKES